MDKLTRRRALRRILSIAGGVAAGSLLGGCVPGAGTHSYSDYYHSSSSSYDNYAHRYIVSSGGGAGYIHYGDGHQ
jgi:hypothetical protein